MLEVFIDEIANSSSYKNFSNILSKKYLWVMSKNLITKF